jgi:aspartate 1-decarboxylase
MLRLMLRSKIHRATVTDANLNYEGSITIDEALMQAAGILPYEQVMVSNINNGERFETYVMPAERGSGTICFNGPAARKGVIGDKVVIFCYEYYNEEELKKFQPTIVKVDEKNRRVK